MFLDPETPVMFLALCWCGPEEADLSSLLFAFDYVNRATLSREQLEGHLNTLLSAGFIEVRRHFRFAIPGAVYHEFEAFRRRRRKGRFEDAEAFVRRHEWLHPAPRLIQIPVATFTRADELFREKFARADRGRSRTR
jgi:hypothetical protein